MKDLLVLISKRVRDTLGQWEDNKTITPQTRDMLWSVFFQVRKPICRMVNR